MAGQHLVALFTRAAQGRVLLPGGMPPVHRRGNLKDPADRRDLETVPVLVDERLHDFPWRSSSAWAKKSACQTQELVPSPNLGRFTKLTTIASRPYKRESQLGLHAVCLEARTTEILIVLH